MITIRRFPLEIVETQMIHVHAGAGLPLALMMVGDRPPTPTVWYAVDDQAPLARQIIFCVRSGVDASHVFTRTGRSMSADYIGTLAYPPSGAIYHFFQKRFT